MNFKTGDILKSYYTADFFEVVAATTKTVTIKALATRGVPCKTYTAHSYETAHMPILHEFENYPDWTRKTNETGKRCRIKESYEAKPGAPCVKVNDRDYAVLWDGAAGIVDHYS